MPRARPQQLSPGRSPMTVNDRGNRPDIVGRRKERKRATDREAQREHRKRKKQYVEELEAKIEFMKATSCTDQVATLLRENEDIRQQLQGYKSFFEDVQSLIGVLRPGQNGSDSTEKSFSFPSTQEHSMPPQPLLDPAQTGATPSANPAEQSESPVAGIGLHSRNLEAQHQHLSPDDLADWQIDLPDYPMPEGQQLLDVPTTSGHSESGLENDEMAIVTCMNFPSDAESDTLAMNIDALPQTFQQPLVGFESTNKTYSTTTIQGLRGWNISTLPDVSFFDRSPKQARRGWQAAWPPSNVAGSHEYDAAYSTSLFELPSQPLHLSQPHDEFGSSDLPIQHHEPLIAPFSTSGRFVRSSGFPAKPPWLCLPILMSPPMPADSRIQEFMQHFWEVRSRGTHARPGRPTVLNFLVNSPTERLSEAVKQYLAPLRASMELPELLACYWIISILIRWYINQDEESFNDLPSWLRPTSIQMRISHPMSIWFMPWPSMRNKLLMSTFHNLHPVTEIMAKLGVYMKVDLSLTHALQAAMTEENSVNRTNFMVGDVPQFELSPDQQPSAVDTADRRHTGLDSDLVHNVLSDLRNWRLHDRFFVQFPYLREAYQEAQQAADGDGGQLPCSNGNIWA